MSTDLCRPTNEIVRVVGSGSRLLFYCPGCCDLHAIVIDGTRGWVWNKDLDKPTVTQSVLSQWTNKTTNETRVCHLFIENGHLRFLGDCTHQYNNVVVPMEPLSNFFEGEQT